MRDGRAKKCKLVEQKDGRAEAKMSGGRAKKCKMSKQKLNRKIPPRCKMTTVPVVPKSSCMLNECPPLGPEGDAERAEVAGYKYRGRVGELLWISRLARPDISHAVNDLARVAHNPGMAHVRAVQHVSRYLSSTASMGLQYNHSPDINHAYQLGGQTLATPPTTATVNSPKKTTIAAHRRTCSHATAR
jgi:hypothetical protein